MDEWSEISDLQAIGPIIIWRTVSKETAKQIIDTALFSVPASIDEPVYVVGGKPTWVLTHPEFGMLLIQYYPREKEYRVGIRAENLRKHPEIKEKIPPLDSSDESKGGLSDEEAGRY